jgi:cyclopropane fatty-acyl-phospholipid synthase-like methyltransferase
MGGTPTWLREKIRAYYAATTETSYLKWGREARALHLGLVEEDDASRAVGLERMNSYLAHRAQIGRGTRVLDAGCGIGGTALWLARQLGAHVIGVTLDPAQVARARQFAEEEGVQNVRFLLADFCQMEFEEGAFDVVLNLESLCHASDHRAYLRHIRKFLREGGRFVCADFFRGRGGNPAHFQSMCQGWCLPAPATMETVAETLHELGFEEVETVNMTTHVLPSAEVMGMFGKRHCNLEKLRASFGEQQALIHYGHFAAAVAAAEGLKSGSVAYGYVGARCPVR